jgi:hypothetical protein
VDSGDPEYAKNIIFSGGWIPFAVSCHQLEQTGVGIKNNGDISNPRHIFGDSRIGDFELLVGWMECDPNVDLLVVFVDDLPSKKGSHECCHSLLPINKNAFAGG